MSENSNIDMLMFDLDGTLWNVLDVTYESANFILKKKNIQDEISKETVASNMGNSFEECADDYLKFIDDKNKRIELMHEICDNTSKFINEKGGDVYNGTIDTIKKLSQKYKLAIVSNAENYEYIDSFLNLSNLRQYFIDIMPASKYNITKAEAMRKVMERNNSKNAVYIGDTEKDRQSSYNAGVGFIYANYGFGKNVNSNYSINNITELIKYFEC